MSPVPVERSTDRSGESSPFDGVRDQPSALPNTLWAIHAQRGEFRAYVTPFD
jgi:hypothetical protein